MRQSGVARLKFNGVELCRNSIKNSSSADPYLAQVELTTSIEFPHCLYKISILHVLQKLQLFIFGACEMFIG